MSFKGKKKKKRLRMCRIDIIDIIDLHHKLSGRTSYPSLTKSFFLLQHSLNVILFLSPLYESFYLFLQKRERFAIHVLMRLLDYISCVPSL